MFNVVQFQDVDAVVGMAFASAPRKMLEFPTLDLSPFDRFGLTPLDDAIRHGHVPVQKLLGICLASALASVCGRCIMCISIIGQTFFTARALCSYMLL